ncbi:MAG: T9SS type A sorting domain-containing protein [Candidatus Kapaibacterium sp.]|nr:T9SS type A sorting domain-containing protein [Bacteroidota bacterium]
MRYIHVVYLLITAFVFCKTQIYAQTVTRNVISNGGIISQNAEVQLQGTLGQGVIAPVSDYETSITQGFWYIATEEQGYNDNTMLSYGSNMLNIHPHPVTNQSTINYTAKEYTSIRIELYTILGEFVKELYNSPNQGLLEIPLNTDELSSGQYNVRVTTDQQQQSIMIIVQK